MISIKLTAKESKENLLCGPSEAGDGPAYPYGTEICLDDVTLEKLGMKVLPPVGTEMELYARVTVSRTSTNQRIEQDGDIEKRSSLDLQITDMALENSTKIDRASKLYGKE